MSGEFPARIALPDGWAPEGIERGPGTTVYVGSLKGRGIWRGDLRTGEGGVFVPGRGPERMALGLCHQPEAGRLWCACGVSGEVEAYDAATGALLETYRPPGELATTNDIAVTDDAVYVTDTFRPRLVVVPLPPDGSLPPASAATTLPLHGEYVQTSGEGDVNLNGIVAVGGVLLVAQMITGKLFRVDPATGATVRVDLGGASLGSPDGLELDGMTLYAVGNRQHCVKVVELDATLAGGRVVDELTDPGLDYPTTAVVSADRLWAVNLRISTVPLDAVKPDTRYWITRLPLRRAGAVV